MNFILAIPYELRVVVLFLLGTAWGALLNLLVCRLAWTPRPISPWNGVWDAVARAIGFSSAASNVQIAKADAAVDKRGNKRGQRDKTRREAPPRQWTHFIPVIGWLGRRGEEKQFGKRFWLRPMLVELLTGAGLALLYHWEIGRDGLLMLGFRGAFPNFPDAHLHLQYLSHAVLFSLMLVASLIDLDEFLIPDAITITGSVVGLLLAGIAPWSRLPVYVPGVPAFPGGARVTLPPYLDIATPHAWPDVLNAGQPWALAMALACLWFWCFAVLPRVWRGRRGWRFALRVLIARMLRERLTYVVLAIGMAGTAAIAAAWQWAGGIHWQGLLCSLVGLACGCYVIWMVRLVAGVVMGREAMGFGDVTLVAMIGAFLGWQTCPIVFFIGPFFGLAAAVLQLVLKRNLLDAIPYGPFLCLGASAVIVFWATIWPIVEQYFDFPWLIPGLLLGFFPVLAVFLGGLQILKMLWRLARPKRLHDKPAGAAGRGAARSERTP
ncbi:MAG: prepilin peptidase [Planctomycetia bacterium]|nr:prepilin peptidase [Planctomycetia bacterium]